MPVDHDRLFKELLKTFFAEFLELFLPDLRRAIALPSLTFLDQEIFTDVTAGERHVADLVARVRCRGQASCFLVHVETQARPQAAFAARMFRYFARLHALHALPVYPVALFSYARPCRPEPRTWRVGFPGLEVLRFRFRVIQLGRLDWRAYLRRRNPIAAALMARMRIAPRDRPRVKAECLRLLATLRLDPARTRLIAGFVDTYLQMSAREETLFQEQVASFRPAERERSMEIVTSWMKKGLRQGRAEGLAQGLARGRREGVVAGQHEGASRVVARLLEKRLGVRPADLHDCLASLSSERLAALAEALLEFRDWDDCRAWLALPHAPGRTRRRRSA